MIKSWEIEDLFAAPAADSTSRLMSLCDMWRQESEGERRPSTEFCSFIGAELKKLGMMEANQRATYGNVYGSLQIAVREAECHVPSPAAQRVSDLARDASNGLTTSVISTIRDLYTAVATSASAGKRGGGKKKITEAARNFSDDLSAVALAMEDAIIAEREDYERQNYMREQTPIEIPTLTP